MRLLCFLHSFEPGGVERTALRLCAAWRDAGMDVSVVLGRPTGRDRGQAPDLDYRVAPQPGFSIAWIETLWMILWLPRFIREQQPDVLFCAGNSYTVVACTMKLLLGRRCPPVVAKISNDLGRRDLSPLRRWFYYFWCRAQGRSIDRWVALSPAMADEAAKALGIRRHRIDVIPNPVLDASRIDALAAAGARSRRTRHGGRRLLAVGRLVGQKDFGSLIAAFALARREGDHLTIIGEGPARLLLEHAVDRAGLRGHVSLPGHCPTIEDWIGRSDVLLLSSRYEGLPGVVIEAMAAGLPVVATDCCTSMSSLIDAPEIGTLVSRGDLLALAQAIARCEPREAPGPGVDRARLHCAEAAAQAYDMVFTRLTAPMPALRLTHPQGAL